MKRWAVVFLCAAVAAILTGGAHYRAEQRRRSEAAQLRAANDQLRAQISQRDSAIPSAAKATPVAPTPSPENRPESPTTGSAGSTRRADVEFYDAGRVTPIAALQTLAWSCENGDAKTAEGLVVYDDAARAKALAFLAKLPPNVQAQWTSPEVAAADVLVDRVKEKPFPVPRLLAQARVEELGPDRVKLRLPGTTYDDMDFRRLESGWAYAITEAEVDQFIDEHSAPPR